MGAERRRQPRYAVCFPVRLDSERKRGRIGMCRNSSVTGMLFGTPSRFELGDGLFLSFRIAVSQAGETRVRARIVRLDYDDRAIDSWCRRLVAVEFEEPLPEIVPLLADEEPRQREWFGDLPAPPPSSS